MYYKRVSIEYLHEFLMLNNCSYTLESSADGKRHTVYFNLERKTAFELIFYEDEVLYRHEQIAGTSELPISGITLVKHLPFNSLYDSFPTIILHIEGMNDITKTLY